MNRARLAVVPLALLFLLAAGPAAASAVSGCRLTAEVLALTPAKGADQPLTLRIRVLRAEAFGHSTAPALCSAAGTEEDFAVDNGDEVTGGGVAVGTRVVVESATVYGGTQDGPRASHTRRYLRVATAEDLPAAPAPAPQP